MQSATGFIIQIAILIFSVVIHEVSHGLAAYALGDSTAKYAGRLTLNPFKHLDPIGSVLVPIVSYLFGGLIFGWALPVPYNPYNLRNQKFGPAIVGAAGPLSNLFLATVFGVLLRSLGAFASSEWFATLANFQGILSYIVLINLVLAVFNFVPIPPLDGSKVLFAVLSYRYQHIQSWLEQYGLVLFFLFIVFFSQAIFPVVRLLFRLATGAYL